MPPLHKPWTQLTLPCEWRLSSPSSRSCQLTMPSRRSRFQRSFFSFNSDSRIGKQEVPRTPPIITMNEDELPKSGDAPPAWSAPASQSQPTPTTITDGLSYNVPADALSQPSMDSAPMSIHPTSCETSSRPMSAHQELHTPASMPDSTCFALLMPPFRN